MFIFCSLCCSRNASAFLKRLFAFFKQKCNSHSPTCFECFNRCVYEPLRVLFCFCCVVLFCFIVLFCFVLFCFVLCCFVSFRFVSFRFVSFCFDFLSCFVLFFGLICFVLFFVFCFLFFFSTMEIVIGLICVSYVHFRSRVSRIQRR